jgi:hypothetical protein
MVYLEKPNTEVEFQSGENKQHQIRYTAAEMQGWRLNMVSFLISLKVCRRMPTSPILSLQTARHFLQCSMVTEARKWRTTHKNTSRTA